jgi:hypothetical protein
MREDQRRTWTKWRNELVKKRTERWSKDMRKREEAFVARKEENSLSVTLGVSGFSYIRRIRMEMVRVRCADDSTGAIGRKIVSIRELRMPTMPAERSAKHCSLGRRGPNRKSCWPDSRKSTPKKWL